MAGCSDTPAGIIDSSASSSIADRYRGRLVVFALRRLGDRSQADDAAQETLRRVIEALNKKQIRDMEALPGFVFRTAQHVCQQWLRKRGREAKALERFASTQPLPLEGMVDQLVTDERRQTVRLAFNRLGSDDRNLLQFFYGMGLSAEEVATRLDASIGTARVRKHRALRKLAALLDGDESFVQDSSPEEP